jgi:hypothetical protein
MMDVKVVKLVNGEELIGEYEETMAGDAIIKDPFGIVYANKGIHLIKYMPYTEDSDRLVIQKQHVIFVRTAVKGMADDYLQARSGIRLGIN